MLDLLQTEKPWYRRVLTWIGTGAGVAVTALGLWHNGQAVIDGAPSLIPYNYARQVANTAASRHDKLTTQLLTDPFIVKERIDNVLGVPISRQSVYHRGAGHSVDGFLYDTDFSNVYAEFDGSKLIGFLYFKKTAVPSIVERYFSLKNTNASAATGDELILGFPDSPVLAFAGKSRALLAIFDLTEFGYAGLGFTFTPGFECKKDNDAFIAAMVAAFPPGAPNLSQLACDKPQSKGVLTIIGKSSGAKNHDESMEGIATLWEHAGYFKRTIDFLNNYFQKS